MRVNARTDFPARQALHVRMRGGVRRSASAKARQSDHIDGTGRHPGVELLEAGFELFLVAHEEGAILAGVGDVHEDAHQFIAEHFALVLPVAADHLRFR